MSVRSDEFDRMIVAVRSNIVVCSDPGNDQVRILHS